MTTIFIISIAAMTAYVLFFWLHIRREKLRQFRNGLRVGDIVTVRRVDGNYRARVMMRHTIVNPNSFTLMLVDTREHMLCHITSIYP